MRKNMYRLSVPFLIEQIDKYGAEPFIKKLKEVGADIAFIAIGPYKYDKIKREKMFGVLKENVSVFKEAGFEVGVWLWTFMMPEANPFTHITSPNGAVSNEQICPSDKEFCDFAYGYLQKIATCSPDIILFDDDFRYGHVDCGLGCACKNHRAFIKAAVGGELPENLGKVIFGGGPNKYRSAFLKANGHFMREFAKRMREAVDSVNPDVRLGLCACMTTWDLDGVSAAELSRILAGKTKPFMRLIGAPYWSFDRGWGNRLQDVIELERMESSWSGEGIEILAEGDSYPRPRFRCSANVLEGFDMALRASGAVSGIHKYVFDYYADLDYEQGYVKKHLQNARVYKKIDELFGDKTPVGVRVYENMTKFENMTVPPCFDGKDDVQDIFHSIAARTLTSHSIPTAYKGRGVIGIAFGENARYLDDSALDNGLILDVTAAKILQDKGIDVGLDGVGQTYTASEEYFPDKNRYVLVMNSPVTEISVKDGAKIDSYFVDGEGEKRIGSYTYKNANGQSFLVLAVEGFSMSEHVFKQYARGEQIVEFIGGMGKKLPASMLGNPDCYMLCKENVQGEKSVFIGNFFSDECLSTTVTLDKEYSEIEFVNCTGRLLGDKVELDSVPPYACVMFSVK
jgi:hypothetical protein